MQLKNFFFARPWALNVLPDSISRNLGRLCNIYLFYLSTVNRSTPQTIGFITYFTAWSTFQTLFREILRKPFIHIRYNITGKLHNTKSQVLSPILNLQYRSMVKSDPAINSCASSNYTYQLPSNNFTYSYIQNMLTSITIFLQWICILMGQNNARIICVLLLYNILRHGLLSRSL